MLVDAHTHVMSSDADRYPRRADSAPWFHGAGDVHSLLTAMDSTGVDAAVVVQFVGAYGYDCSCAADAVAGADGRLALVGAVDMDGPDPAGAVTTLAGSTPATAVRVFGVGGAEPTWLADGRAEAVWRAAASAGMGVVVTLWERDLSSLRPLAERHRDVPVAVDHCAFSDFSAGAEALFALADVEAVNVKVSSHVLAELEDPAAVVEALAARFGPARLAWGSDHPQTGGGYEALVALAHRASGRLDEAARADFLAGTARRLWFR